MESVRCQSSRPELTSLHDEGQEPSQMCQTRPLALQTPLSPYPSVGWLSQSPVKTDRGAFVAVFFWFSNFAAQNCEPAASPSRSHSLPFQTHRNESNSWGESYLFSIKQEALTDSLWKVQCRCLLERIPRAQNFSQTPSLRLDTWTRREWTYIQHKKSHHVFANSLFFLFPMRNITP